MATSRTWLVALLGTLALVGQPPTGSANFLVLDNDGPVFADEAESRFVDARHMPSESSEETTEEAISVDYWDTNRDPASDQSKDTSDPLEKIMSDLQPILAAVGKPKESFETDDSTSSGDDTFNEQDKAFKEAIEQFGRQMNAGLPSMMAGPMFLPSGQQQPQPAEVESSDQVQSEETDDDFEHDVLGDIAQRLLQRSMLRQAMMNQQEAMVPADQSEDETGGSVAGSVLVITAPDRDAALPGSMNSQFAMDNGIMSPLSRFFQSLGGGAMRQSPFAQMQQQAGAQPMFGMPDQGAPLMEINPNLNSGLQPMVNVQPVMAGDESSSGVAIVAVPAWRIIERTVYIVSGKSMDYSTTTDVNVSSPASIMLSLLMCVMFIMGMIWAVMRLGRLIQGRRKGDSVTTKIFGGARGGPYSPPAYVHTTLPSPATRIDTVAIATGGDEKKTNHEKPPLDHSNV